MSQSRGDGAGRPGRRHAPRTHYPNLSRTRPPAPEVKSDADLWPDWTDTPVLIMDPEFIASFPDAGGGIN
jgi:hypothetical protein